MRKVDKQLSMMANGELTPDTEVKRQGHHVTVGHIYFVKTGMGLAKMNDRELDQYIDRLLDIEDNNAYGFVFSNGAIV